MRCGRAGGEREVKQEEPDEILRLHEAWMDGKDGGERADLQGADLRNAILEDIDFRRA